MAPRTSFTWILDAGQQARLKRVLSEGNYRPVPMPHTVCAGRTPECTVALYTSGKCLVQGKGAEDFVTFVMEPTVLHAAQRGYEDLLNPEGASPHMGVDESGKGDFFGPLVVAAAYVDRDAVQALREMKVRDSKSISSDASAMQIAAGIRNVLGQRLNVVSIGPRAYNRLYARMRNLNRLLAWAHARAIENLLETVPDCPLAISDQFGNKNQVKTALMQRGRKIELVQRPRAETDMAVAAASILARDGFLRGLRDMGRTYAVAVPKGASDRVRETAVELVRKGEPAVLLETAKCHFKTADAVLAELGLDRSALGPEGQAVSKPPAGRYGKRKAADAVPGR